MRINRTQYSHIIKLLADASSKFKLEDQYRLHVAKCKYETNGIVAPLFMQNLEIMLRNERKI